MKLNQYLKERDRIIGAHLAMVGANVIRAAAEGRRLTPEKMAEMLDNGLVAAQREWRGRQSVKHLEFLECTEVEHYPSKESE